MAPVLLAPLLHWIRSSSLQNGPLHTQSHMQVPPFPRHRWRHTSSPGAGFVPPGARPILVGSDLGLSDPFRPPEAHQPTADDVAPHGGTWRLASTLDAPRRRAASSACRLLRGV
jgi:hypothetical protein